MVKTFGPNVFKIVKQFIDNLLGSGDVVLASQIGVPNGVVGTDSNGDIVATSIHRTGTAAALAATTLKAGEIAVTNDTKDILLGDGVTVGGVALRPGGVHYRGRGEVLTRFTGTETGSPLLSFPIIAGGIYDISGTLGFAGDTDNLSNVMFRWRGSAGVQVLLNPEANELKFFMPEYSWLHSFSSAITPDYVINPLQDINGTWISNPIALDKPSGVCKFHLRIPILNAIPGSTYGMQCYLRTDKVVPHTIMASYEVFVQRVK